MHYPYSLPVDMKWRRQLTYLQDVVDDAATQHKIDACQTGMQEGKSFVQCLQDTALYQGVYASMIITGFHSGKSDEVMQKVTPYMRRMWIRVSLPF